MIAGRTIWCGLALVMAPLAWTSTAVASPPPSSPPPSPSPVAQGDQATDKDKVLADFRAGRMTDALKRLDQMLKSTPAEDTEFRVDLLSTRAIALSTLGRIEEADATLDELEKIAPGSPLIGIAQLDAARAAGDADRGVAVLQRLVTDHPRTAMGLPWHVIGWPVHALVKAGRSADASRLALAMLRAGQASDNRQWRGWLELFAIQALIETGDLDRAVSIVGSIDDAELVTNLLIDRRYSALWQRIEAQVTPGLANVHDRAIAAAKRSVAAAPDSDRSRLDLFDAYVRAGRAADADAFAMKIGATPQAMAALSEFDGWLVNNHARLLRDLGRETEADARMAAMRVISIEEKPWVVNMLINHLGDKVYGGNWAAALALLDEVEPLAAKHTSPYATQVVRGYRLCALYRGRPGSDIAALLATVMAKARDAPLPTAKALSCIGDFDAAEPLLVGAFAFFAWRGRAIETMQPERDRPLAKETVWTAWRETLNARPAVQAAFAREARQLPERLRPVALDID